MNSSIHIQYYKSPIGELLLGVFENQLCIADWRYRRMRTSIDKRITNTLKAEYKEASHPIIDLTIKQLDEYFTGTRSQFDIPIHFVGSDFQISVWKELIQIPYGKTVSYLSLSRKLKNEKAIRAVASANGANAISIIVPCHRVIGSDGKLTGYAGGLPAKKKLLMLEGVDLSHGQIALF